VLPRSYEALNSLCCSPYSDALSLSRRRDNTFSNHQEANRTFWRQTVIPLVQRTADALSTWLAPAYAEPLTIRPDLDSIDALSSEREALWTRLEKASFLTTDEKRAAIGYGPMPANQTTATKFNPHHAHDGRFDFSPDGAQPVAFRPKPSTPPPPTKPAQPPPKPIDPPPNNPGAYGKTPKGLEYTEHAEGRANQRGFTSDRIDAIVDNNGRSRVGKVDGDGKKTWEYTDSRGNTVVTNDRGGIVSTFSNMTGGVYVSKP
jgi:hypothetical protein